MGTDAKLLNVNTGEVLDIDREYNFGNDYFRYEPEYDRARGKYGCSAMDLAIAYSRSKIEHMPYHDNSRDNLVMSYHRMYEILSWIVLQPPHHSIRCIDEHMDEYLEIKKI